MSNELTQEQLKRWIWYDPATGLFFWCIAGRYRKIGEAAGHAHSKGYIAISFPCGKYLAHRLVFLYMTGNWPVGTVDHINRDKTDNSWENLRDTSRTQNLYNSKDLWRHNRSGEKGVLFYARYGKWQASLKHNNTQIYLGRYNTKEEAIAARKAAEEIYYERA